jgi:superfamily II DNA or RNA helicase
MNDFKINPNYKYLIVVPWIDIAKQLVKQANHLGIKTCFIGGSSRIKKPDNSVLTVCITASIHKLKEHHYRFKFLDEAHHIETENSINYAKISKITCDRELQLSATFHNKEYLDYKMSLRYAIDSGYVTDYRIHVKYFTKGNRDDLLLKMLVENQADWGVTFVYFNSADRVKYFAKELLNSGVQADYLLGECSNVKRESIITKIEKGLLRILCLCGCYNEGISINSLTTVVFGDFRYSPINRVQVAMRAGRIYYDKPFSRIVFPISEDDLDDDDFGDLIRTFYDIDPQIKNAIKNKI